MIRRLLCKLKGEHEPEVIRHEEKSYQVVVTHYCDNCGEREKEIYRVGKRLK